MKLLPTGDRTVPAEWIDYNGHMMDAYYFMAFTEATEAFLDHVGLGAAYQARTGSGIYTAESHLCFLAGVTEGAALAYQTQLLGRDAKRLHVFHLMTSASILAATCELMFLHVSAGRVTPMPPDAARAVAALAAGQAALPRPGQAGRRVGIPAQTGLTRRVVDLAAEQERDPCRAARIRSSRWWARVRPVHASPDARRCRAGPAGPPGAAGSSRVRSPPAGRAR